MDNFKLWISRLGGFWFLVTDKKIFLQYIALFHVKQLKRFFRFWGILAKFTTIPFWAFRAFRAFYRWDVRDGLKSNVKMFHVKQYSI